MQKLVAGYLRFQNEVFPEQREFFEALSAGQSPDALVITCADSRIDPGLLLQSGPGELFVVRNVGNIVPPHGEFTGGISSAIEYAVMALQVRHIIVLGHSDCGAMKARKDPDKIAHLPAVRTWLKHSESARHMVEHNYPGLEDDAWLRALTEENVIAQIEHLETHPSVAARLRKGGLQLHGWIYDIRRGGISALVENHKFVPLAEAAALQAAT